MESNRQRLLSQNGIFYPTAKDPDPSNRVKTALQINIISLPVTMNRKIEKPPVKFSQATIKHPTKLVLRHSLCK